MVTVAHSLCIIGACVPMWHHDGISMDWNFVGNTPRGSSRRARRRRPPSPDGWASVARASCGGIRRGARAGTRPCAPRGGRAVSRGWPRSSCPASKRPCARARGRTASARTSGPCRGSRASSRTRPAYSITRACLVPPGRARLDRAAVGYPRQRAERASDRALEAHALACGKNEWGQTVLLT